MLADQILQGHFGLMSPILWRVRVNHRVVDQISVSIKNSHFTPSAEAWIDRKNHLGSDWWLQQKTSQIAGEDFDGMFFSGFGEVATNFPLQARTNHPFQSVEGSIAENRALWVSIKWEVVENSLFEIHLGNFELDFQDVLFFATIEGQNAMWRNVLDWLAVLKVIAIIQPLAFFKAFILECANLAESPDHFTGRIPDQGQFADGFSQNVANAFEHLIGCFYSLFRIQKLGGSFDNIAQRFVAIPDSQCKWLKAFLTCFAGFCTLLGLVW